MADEHTPGERQGRPLDRADEGLSINEAARQLGVHHQTLRNWIARGDVGVTRFGPRRGIVRIHPHDLEDARHGTAT